MKFQHCPDVKPHGRHEWYWKNILRHDCFGVPDDSPEALMDEIVAMHNELYHPGQDCPEEDEDGACAIRTGKPTVLRWVDNGFGGRLIERVQD